MFAKEATLMIHMKCHIICQKCGKGFKKESELMGHVTSVHSSMSNSKNALNEVKTNTCEDCGHIAKTRKSLMMHKETKHIEDSWLVNTKREQNMMSSEHEHKTTKTEEPNLKRVKKRKKYIIFIIPGLC
jgi:ribosomal protein L37E